MSPFVLSAALLRVVMRPASFSVGIAQQLQMSSMKTVQIARHAVHVRLPPFAMWQVFWRSCSSEHVSELVTQYQDPGSTHANQAITRTWNKSDRL